MRSELKPPPMYPPVPMMALAVVLNFLGKKSPNNEKPTGSVTDTKRPKINLMRKSTPNELVVPEITVLALHIKTADNNRFFLFTLSTRRPMKIPTKA